MNLRNRLPFYISLVQKGLEWFGYPLICTKAKAKALKNLTLWGKSVQNGTPTPTAPVEIESVGDRTINLANQNATINYPYTYYGYSVDLDAYSLQVKLKEGKTIPAGAYFGIVRRDSSGRHSAKWALNNGALTNNGFASTSESEISLYIDYGLACYPSTKSTWDAIFDAFDIMFVQGLYSAQTMPSYEPYGYKVPVTVGGKNLFDNKYPIGYSGSAPNIVEIEGVSTEWYKVSDVIDTDRRITLIFNSKVPHSAQVLGVVYSNDKITLEKRVGLRNTSTYQANEEVKFTSAALDTVYTYVKFYYTRAYDMNYLGVFTNPNSEYAPYIEPTTTNIYLNEPLRKIGDYADTMSVDGTTVTVTRNVGSSTISNANPVVVRGDISNNRFLITGINVNGLNDSSIICNLYKYDGQSFDGGGDFTITGFSASNNGRVCIRDTRYNSLDSFKNYISNSNIEIIIALATSTTETYTIPEAITLPGECVITTDTTVSPSDMYGKQ